MTLAEKLYSILGPLVGGRVYHDETPKDGPEDYPFIVIVAAGGKTTQYVEGGRPAMLHNRVAISYGVRESAGASAREHLGWQIEEAMLNSDLPAVEQYGRPISGADSTLGELYGQLQFGVYFTPQYP